MKQIYHKISVVLIILLISTQSASSQSLQDRYFSGVAVSYLDYFRGPLLLEADSLRASSMWHLGIITLSYNPRFNLFEFGNNASLSVNAPITVGVGMGGGGFGTFAINIPATINLNLGNVSTYNSDANKGFTLGAGMEGVYLTQPLVALDEIYYADEKRYWFQPVANIGYRYWNKENNANEFNLKVGYGSSSVDVKEDYNSSEIKTVTGNSVSFRLSFIHYLNY